MSARIGSMFSGYGGLDLAVSEVTGGATAWVADVCGTPDTKNWPHKTPCKSPCTILAHRFPDAPNLGDVAAIQWTPDCPDCGAETRAVNQTPGEDGYIYWCPSCRGEFPVSIRPDGMPTPVDILGAGFPCQDVSTAGKRAGLRDGTRTGLWSEVIRAIVALNPRLVVLENVPGIFTAPASGDVEPCSWCVGDDPDGALRALDAVLADLAEVGFDAEWVCVPASGVGAPHKRERWFLAAHPAGQPWSFEHGDDGATADADGRLVLAGVARADQRPVADGDAGSPAGTLLPTPSCSDTNGAGQHGDGGLDLRTAVSLMPTPRATDGTKGGPNQRGSSGDLMLPSAVMLLPTPMANEGEKAGQTTRTDGGQQYLTHVIHALLPTPAAHEPGGSLDDYRARLKAHDGRESTFAPLSMAVQLLPTLRTQNNENRQSEQFAGEDGNFYGLLHNPERWGEYAPAIARWEAVIGRPAPEPTQTSTKGNPQLSPRFTEWMMGLPDGWITDVPGITRNEALKACGNGVVPQQAAAALRTLLARVEVVA